MQHNVKNWHLVKSFLDLCGQQREITTWKKKLKGILSVDVVQQSCRYLSCACHCTPCWWKAGETEQDHWWRKLAWRKIGKEPGTDRTTSRHSGLRYREIPRTSRSLAPPPFTSEFLLRWSQPVHSRIGMVYSIPNATTHLDACVSL